MLARLISLRLPSVLPAVLGVVCLSILPGQRPAFAQGQSEREDESDEGGGEEDASAADPNQPLVTAGGNYSVVNYPLSEVERTLLIPQGGIEAQLRYDADLSKDVAFKTNTFTLFARYGVTPLVNARAAFTFDITSQDSPETGSVPKTKILNLEGELALLYDVIDFCGGILLNFTNSDRTLFDIVAGLPVKWRFNDKLAVVGLERLLVVHTKAAVDGGDTAPDINISVAGELCLIPQFAIILRASLDLINAQGDQKVLPVDLTLQYTVAHQFDVALGFTLTQLTPPSTMPSPGVPSVSADSLDGRALHLFVQGRL